MRIRIKLVGALRNKLPNTQGSTELEMESGATVTSVLEKAQQHRNAVGFLQLQHRVIDHGPGTGANIDSSIHYDHSSLVATVRELVGRPVDPLTERDQIAPTFTHLFRDVRRGDGDCPEKLGREWGVE